ncbi:phytanoyl-CoA dioxygenase family protein [Pseudanabaena mucicola]|uniref:Phytanoyl-CoA dioxygenase n=1 Tax=Pseudanabaena mucicola FACHB-723 TaxID=2692860 RepID=A0ABR7ZWW8_9CYAN|nr:hypothetical protein [Pseudanabaena mucicola]MBD2188317.1 hypothetical protein [Pseudanabaena mucicola FACHB-723]
MNPNIISQTYQAIEKLWQRIISIPSDIALFISNLDMVERRILYPRYQKFLQEYQPLINSPLDNEWKIVKELKAYGVAITHLDDLAIPHSDRFLQSAQSVAKELQSATKLPVNLGKHTLNISAEQVMRYPELFIWGADIKLLRIIENYLKLPVAYDGLSYYYSLPDGKQAGPRKWHRDKEDWQIVKVGVYINDVNDDGGPFECVTPEVNDFLCQELLSKSWRRYKTALHEDIEAMLPEELQKNWYKSCTGKAGTVIFVDTARYYHRGKPPSKFERAAIFFGYCSQKPRHPFFCGRSPLLASQLQYMASLLPADTRDCVTWRDRLKGLGKWIPKNRLKV